MTDIYINRKGITYEAKVSIHSVGQEDAVWVAEIDDELFYVELASSSSIVDIIKAVQDEFNAARDQDELDGYKTEANALGKEAGLEGDVFDMIVQWYSEVVQNGKETAEAFSKVEVVETEAKEYHTGVVADFIEAMGFTPSEVWEILVRNRVVKFSVQNSLGDKWEESFPINPIAGA